MCEPRLWWQPLAGSATHARAAAASTHAGLLPEDAFDTQPLLAADGAVLVAQCRLDGRARLAEALGMADTARVADAALLLAAYERWGQGCVDRLEGDFAFAVYRPGDRSVFAAVDATGQSRLFFRDLGDCGLLLSAQLRVLAHAGDAKLRPNMQALGVLAAGLQLPFVTGFAEARLVEAGHALRWREGRAELGRWWLPATEPDLVYARPEEYVEHTAALLTEAVRDALRTTCPVSASLSGGLDSGLVTATAARELAARGAGMTAYTAAPAPGRPTIRRRGWDADDLPFAAATAALHPNLQHVHIPTAEGVALDLFGALREGSAVPVRNGANHVWMSAMAQAAFAAGSRVLLTGGRGNYTLSANGVGAVVELMRRMRLRAALQLARQMEAVGERKAWKAVLGALLPQSTFDAMRQRLFGRQEETDELPPLTREFRLQHRQLLEPRKPALRTRAAFVRRAMLPAPVWMADPLPQWGIQMRDPTANRRLVETMLRMPLDAFVQRGRMRGIAREAGRGLLPDEVRLRRTQGQQGAAYPAAVRASADRYEAAIARLEANLLTREVFDTAVLRGMVQALRAGANTERYTSGLDRAVGAGLFALSVEENGW